MYTFKLVASWHKSQTKAALTVCKIAHLPEISKAWLLHGSMLQAANWEPQSLIHPVNALVWALLMFTPNNLHMYMYTCIEFSAISAVWCSL